MTVKLSGPMIAPESGAVRKAMVLLHGYGSDGNDLIALTPYFQDVLPQALFVAPNAPQPCAINPMGYEWFAIDHTRLPPDFSGIRTVRPIVTDFLRDLWAQTGIGPADTILAGFSQGAMIALDTGLHLDEDLCAIVAFSGGIPPEETPDFAKKSQVKVCLVHGDMDDVVPLAMSLRAQEALKKAGIPVQLHVSEGTGHGIAPDGIAFAREFIADPAATKSN